jgi:long-chain acyl-CoA synthetase
MSETLPDVGFWALAYRMPARVAVIEADGTQVTAGELLAAANQAVHGLRARGLQRGDVVAVSLRNSRVLLELYLAAMQAGWHFAALSPRLKAGELAHILGHRPAVHVFEAEVAERVTEAAQIAGFDPARCLAVGDYRAVMQDQPTDTPSDRCAGAKLYYTGGTTGLPKAIRRPLTDEPPEIHGVRAIGHLVEWFADGMVGFGIERGLIHLVTSPLYHSASLLWCTDNMHLGHTVVLMDKWTPEAMLERIERYRVTGTLTVPTHLHRLLSLPPEVRARVDVSSLRHVVHTGAPCAAALKRQMLEWWGPVIYEVYGSAEGGGTWVGPTEWLRKPGTVGRAAPKVVVLRDDGGSCDPDEVGTIYFTLEGNAFEYEDDPDATARGRRGNYFTVGDLGYVDGDGFLFLCDRKTDVIISGGINIYPAGVEAVLIAHPDVRDVAVFGIPDDEWGESVKAVVEPMPSVTPGPGLEQALMAYCRQHLSSVSCPRSIDFVDQVPRDPSGKLQRRVVRAPYWEGRDRSI